MAQRLPPDPSVELLKNHAKLVQKAVRDGVTQAVDLVRGNHPRLGDLTVGAPEAVAFKLADAQLTLARHYGFPSWAKLRQHLEVIDRHRRSPHLNEPGGPTTTREERVDEFLRLACLTHGGDDPSRWKQADELLAADPDLTSNSIHAAAAAGDVGAVRSLLAADPTLAATEGGPHGWEPILYLTYAAVDDTVPGRSRLEAARVLLDAGADPAAGYLWEGLPSPYTALTGALSSPHADRLGLGRLLLERGADANDSQALYELGFETTGDDPEYLELLLAFGLGKGDGGVWHRRLIADHATPTQLVEDELTKAAANDWPRRARVVLSHGVDVNGRGTNHPVLEGLSAWELAVANGRTGVVAVLVAGGAKPAEPDPALDLLGAAIRADRSEIERLVAADPMVVAAARARRPHQLSVAAAQDRMDAVVLLLELGFDVNASYRYPYDQTALHGAALNGNLTMVKYLVEHGADITAEDCGFHATPLGWADHNEHTEVAAYLSSLET